jgi:hypothetical protein
MLANKRKIDKKTRLIPVTVGTHQEMLNLDITETFTYNITFGLSWLKKYDPRINYKKELLNLRIANANLRQRYRKYP